MLLQFREQFIQVEGRPAVQHVVAVPLQFDAAAMAGAQVEEVHVPRMGLRAPMHGQLFIGIANAAQGHLVQQFLAHQGREHALEPRVVAIEDEDAVVAEERVRE